MEQRTPCLWVAYEAVASNGMILSSNGFFEGQLPITPPMMKRVETEIKNTAQDGFSKLKQVDTKGKVVIGAPQILVQAIKILCVQSGEQIENLPVN